MDSKSSSSSPAALPSSLSVVFMILLVDVIGLGIIVPILPSLLQTFFNGNVQDSAYFYGLLSTLYGVMQFFFAPCMGALSDRWGRRPILLGSLIGLACDYCIMAMAQGLPWFVIARLLSGVMGASYSTAMAYIGDVSESKTRTQNFGLVGAAFGLGFIAGPAIGGTLGHFDLRWPFWTAGVLALINAICAYYFLPESLPPHLRRPVQLKQLNPLGAFLRLSQIAQVRQWLGSYALSSVARRLLETFWVIFMAYRFHWGVFQVALSLVAMGLLSALVQGGLIRVLKKKFTNAQLIRWGFRLKILGFSGLAFVSQPWHLAIFLPLLALGAISEPAIHSTLSEKVGDRLQGALQGLVASSNSVSGMIAPLLATSLFVHFSGEHAWLHLPGLPFLISALLCAVAFFCVRSQLK